MLAVQSKGEALIVAELVEVVENSTIDTQTLPLPFIITVNKSDGYALYGLTRSSAKLISFVYFGVCFCISIQRRCKVGLDDR